jgi:anthranilate/para-aminobenzoate synthase component I
MISAAPRTQGENSGLSIPSAPTWCFIATTPIGIRPPAGARLDRLTAPRMMPMRWRTACTASQQALGNAAIIPDWQSNFTREDYEAPSRRTVDYILAGDIFQANITQTFLGPNSARLRSARLLSRAALEEPRDLRGLLDYGGIQIAFRHRRNGC